MESRDISDLLYQCIERSEGVKDLPLRREIPVDDSIRNRDVDRSRGAIPKQFPRNDQHGRQERRSPSFTRNGPEPRESNWGGRGNDRRGRGSGPETWHNSHRGRGNGPETWHNSHRGRGNGPETRGNGTRGRGSGSETWINSQRGRGNGPETQGNGMRGRGSGSETWKSSQRGRGNGPEAQENSMRGGGRGNCRRGRGNGPTTRENSGRGRGNSKPRWNPEIPDNAYMIQNENEHGRMSISNQKPMMPPELMAIDVQGLEKVVVNREKAPQTESEDIKGFRYMQIKELLKKESSDLLMHLCIHKQDFSLLLKQNLRPDMVMLVVEMFAKVSSSSMKENLAALLAHSVHSSILEQFSAHSFNIVAQNMYKTNEVIKYFENLYTLYQDVVDIMPSKASEILSDHSTRAVMALQNLKLLRKVSIPPKLEEDYGILMASVESLQGERKSAPQRRYKEIAKKEWQPGIDFRQLSVHPLPQDLLCKGDVNICPVVIDGPYKSVEHYLDVQFNLMREDFLIPLRDGIANFIEQQSAKSEKRRRIENVRFYRGVRFLNQCIDGDSLVTEVQFVERNRAKRSNWKRSKRFMFGALLCFTCDTFKTILLGIVCDRRVELLEKGILRCELLGDVRDDDGLFQKEFIMAENEVYFEAYQHVLRALQNFDNLNFPLKEYLIDVSRDLHLPTYLANNPYAMYKVDDYEFPVIDEHFWPPQEHLQVNESQFKALHSALTKKCAVIQGPPGTGKTYLGLVIAKMLLKNAEQWRQGGKCPMLVVCFTNHALDQFLEGMLSFTNNIVRVGGQSKNENLNDYNLRVVRRKKGIRGIALHGLEADLEQCAWAMNHNNDFLKECLKNAGIFSLEVLWHWMGEHHVSWFSINGNLKDSMLVEWLLSGALYHDMVDVNVSTEDLEPITESMTDTYALSLENLKLYIEQLNSDALEATGNEQEGIHGILMMYIGRFHYLRSKLDEPFQMNEELIAELSAVKNLNDLRLDLRWVLYNYWMSQAVNYYQGKLMEKRREYQLLNKQKLEIMETMYLDTIMDCDIVGMTTTGAARHQSMLQKLGAKIVIVEEAAEAMESHIVVCLSSKCEHLILIGDHKQLRPSPAVYKLAKHYHLEISLFERLLMNGIRFDTLKIQHRMRPDIADLVFPAVYPELENHPTVMAYDSIIGLKKNLFFITHTHPEEMAMDDLSKRNSHEAQFLIALCRHIILQGYEPSQITILATYLGQMFLLCEEREKHSITKDVRIAVVDNFQGEENDIILLSLVRNNSDGKIGFLTSENRTCVSLSRAKKGLYVMGNIDLLAENSSLWSQIKKVLNEKQAVGTHLTLQCLKHPDQLTEVSKAEDFLSITEGGCTQMCGERLHCGHICKKMCHVQGHLNYKCHEVCGKLMCSRNHLCKKFCWEDCGDCMVLVESTLPCGHTASLPCHLDPQEYECLVEVSVTLPDCEHTNQKLCFEDVKKMQCSFPCDSRLPCGHICTKVCHVKCDPEHLEYKCLRPCGRKNLDCQDEHICQRRCFEECGLCTVKVKRKLPNCDHFYNMECAIDPSSILCQKPCRKKLDCGHDCPKKCMDLCGGCPIIVEKEIPDCKHKMRLKCCEVPVRRFCKNKCARTRTCGHKCTGICGVPCSEKKCESLSTRTARALCGHEVRLFCHEIYEVPTAEILMKRCREACGKILMCEHRCKGTCGGCLQGRIHIPCQEKCGKNLICGHECTVACSQSCPPCRKNCFVLCEHSKCKNKCGKPCSLCQEKCGWQCEHQKCSKKCSEQCDRPPCNEPCKKKLQCGHDCIGFCGEKCPPLCRLCNAEEVDDIMAFLATEDEENARFVVLPDCNHVFEVTGLDRWLSLNDGTVKMLECPQCKTPIQRAYRYGNKAKDRFCHVLQVKTKIYGNLRKINNKVIQSAGKLKTLTNSDEYLRSKNRLDELQELVRRSKRETFGASVLNSLEARTDFVLSIVKHLNDLKPKISPRVLPDILSMTNRLIRILLVRLDIMSDQERADFEGECKRFHLTLLLRALENTEGFTLYRQPYWYKEYEKYKQEVEGMKIFEKAKYSEAYKKLNEIYKSITNGNIGLSEHEMVEVVSALNLHQGHWVLCPNGHVFVIADCGGAVSEGRCNECGERIGGSSYQLHANNRRIQEFKKSQSSLDELQHLIGMNRKAHFGVFMLNSLEARTEFVLSVVEHFNEQKKNVNKEGALGECTKTVNLLIKTMLMRLEMISAQEHSDFEGECMRFHLLMNLRALENTLQFKSYTKAAWYEEYQICRLIIEDSGGFPKNSYSEVFRQLNEVYKTLTSGPIGLSKEEMRQVVAAVGLHQGHWYRCPNGHVFSIGDCGRAYTVGRCNECGARIGGGGHVLLADNSAIANLPEGL